MDLWAIVRIMNKWAKYKCSPLRCHKKNTEQATYALYNHHISFSYVCNSVLLNERDSIRATRFFARDVCVVLSFNAAWCVFCLVASAFHYKSFVFDCCFLYSPSASIWILFVTIPYHPPPLPHPLNVSCLLTLRLHNCIKFCTRMTCVANVCNLYWQMTRHKSNAWIFSHMQIDLRISISSLAAFRFSTKKKTIVIKCCFSLDGA